MSRRRSPEREPQGRSRDGVHHRRVLGASHEVARPGVAETLVCELRCGAGAIEEDVHECGTEPGRDGLADARTTRKQAKEPDQKYHLLLEPVLI